jgi:hypothetical protein
LLLIQRVYLTNNSISHIEDRAFEPMQALKFLDLSLNRSVIILVSFVSRPVYHNVKPSSGPNLGPGTNFCFLFPRHYLY